MRGSSGCRRCANIYRERGSASRRGRDRPPRFRGSDDVCAVFDGGLLELSAGTAAYGSGAERCFAAGRCWGSARGAGAACAGQDLAAASRGWDATTRPGTDQLRRRGSLGCLRSAALAAAGRADRLGRTRRAGSRRADALERRAAAVRDVREARVLRAGDGRARAGRSLRMRRAALGAPGGLGGSARWGRRDETPRERAGRLGGGGGEGGGPLPAPPRGGAREPKLLLVDD